MSRHKILLQPLWFWGSNGLGGVQGRVCGINCTDLTAHVIVTLLFNSSLILGVGVRAGVVSGSVFMSTSGKGDACLKHIWLPIWWTYNEVLQAVSCSCHTFLLSTYYMPGSVLGTGDSVSKKDTVLTRISNCLQYRCPGRITGPNWVSKALFLVRWMERVVRTHIHYHI